MRWRILILLFLARVALGFQFQTLASVSDDLVVAFGFDYAEIGLLIGLFMAPGLVLALPAGLLGRFASDRILTALAFGALALGGLVSSLADSGFGIGIGRVLAGAGFLLSSLYMTKMVVDWFEGRETATAMSVFVMSWPFGIAMGQVGHAWLTEMYGWHMPFRIAALYCCIAGVAVLAFYRAPADQPTRPPGPTPSLTPREWQLVACAAAAWGLLNAGYVIYLAFGPGVLQSFGLSSLSAAGIVSVGSWLMIASGAICGVIVDRFGHRRAVLVVCISGAVLALWLLIQPGMGLAASLLFGIIGIAPAGVIMALAGEAMRAEVRAFGMGVFFTIYSAFMLGTPPVAGALLDLSGHVTAPIWLAMGLFAMVLLLVLCFERLKSLPQGKVLHVHP